MEDLTQLVDNIKNIQIKHNNYNFLKFCFEVVEKSRNNELEDVALELNLSKEEIDSIKTFISILIINDFDEDLLRMFNVIDANHDEINAFLDKMNDINSNMESKLSDLIE